MLLKKSLLDVR